MIVSKKPPYQNTKVDPDKTRMDVDKLLRKYGVSAIQWTNDYDHNIVVVQFRMEKDGKVYSIKKVPPSFTFPRVTYNSKTGKHEKVDLPNWAASMRFLYNSVKSRLEEVAYGGVTIEEAFLADIIIPLKDGTTTTMYQALKNAEVFEKGLFLEDKTEQAAPYSYSEEKLAEEANYTEAT